MKSILFALVMLVGLVVQAQSPVGTWKTIDDKSGKPKSQVQIYETNGKYYGKIVKFLDPATDPKRICDDCTDARKDQPVMGMVIVEGLKQKPGFLKWQSGTILDPESGDVYGCEIWFEAGKPDDLRVKGRHWTGLSRTQTWYRVK
jgi:uncharacterized protein (DUF2147 family)